MLWLSICSKLPKTMRMKTKNCRRTADWRMNGYRCFAYFALGLSMDAFAISVAAGAVLCAQYRQEHRGDSGGFRVGASGNACYRFAAGKGMLSALISRFDHGSLCGSLSYRRSDAAMSPAVRSDAGGLGRCPPKRWPPALTLGGGVGLTAFYMTFARGGDDRRGDFVCCLAAGAWVFDSCSFGALRRFHRRRLLLILGVRFLLADKPERVACFKGKFSGKLLPFK
jgi:hypothetical protein